VILLQLIECNSEWKSIVLEQKLLPCQMDGRGQLNKEQKGKLLESLTATFISEY